MVELNSDSFKIRNYELTDEGYLKIWIAGGIPDLLLEYDGRPSEKVTEDILFNQDSLDSAVGKPISFNHPPRAITNQNYRDFISGAILQEFAKEPETNALIMSSIVYDSKIVEGITKGELKYVSASYKADKEPNNDGTLTQKSRRYNHFAILSPEYEPRAGKASRILIYNQDSKELENPDKPTEGTVTPSDPSPVIPPNAPTTPEPTAPEPTPTPEPLEKPSEPVKPGVVIETPTQPSTPVIEPQNPPLDPNTDSMTITKDEIASRVELLTTFKSVLDSAGKTVDYNLDSKAIKREVLSVYYTEGTMKQVNDANLDGFWLGFITNNDSVKSIIGETRKPLTGVDNNDSMASFEATAEAEIEKFRKQMEGVK